MSRHISKLSEGGFNQLKRAVGCFMLAHLGNKLGVVQEEEFNVRGFRVSIVTEKSNEHLEHGREMLRVL